MGGTSLFGLNMMQERIEKIWIIQERMKAAQSWQKTYEDWRRRPLEFPIGDKIFLKVLAMKEMVRIDRKNKLDPQYVVPFEILEKIRLVVYWVALPSELEKIHNVFHVSQLTKYISDPGHIISYQALQIQEDLSYMKEPVQILNH